MSIDTRRLIEQLAEAGLDLVHAFDAHAVGELARAEAIREEQDARSSPEPTLTSNRDGSTRMMLAKPSRPLARWTRLATGPRIGLLVGNTRALWPHFVAARGSLPATNPLDTYVERVVPRAIEGAASTTPSDVTGLGHEARADRDPRVDRSDFAVVYSHLRYGAAFLPFQQLAVTTGLAAQSDAGLAVHPVYGPWFALRAVIAIDPPTKSPEELAELADLASRNARPDLAIHVLAMPAPRPIAKPCVCTGACETALAIARADLRDWRAWLAVRDACSLRAYRYSDEQIRFHYASAWPKAARDE